MLIIKCINQFDSLHSKQDENTAAVIKIYATLKTDFLTWLSQNPDISDWELLRKQIKQFFSLTCFYLPSKSYDVNTAYYTVQCYAVTKLQEHCFLCIHGDIKPLFFHVLRFRNQSVGFLPLL